LARVSEYDFTNLGGVNARPFKRRFDDYAREFLREHGL
jgi:hypothetical protein